MEYVDPKIFEPILGKDEEIIETFKPNKTREVGLNILALFIACVVIIAFPLIITAISIGTESRAGAGPLVAMTCMMLGIGLIAIIVGTIYITVGYKNKAFAITNKRILIKSGVIGVDFKTAEFDLIGGISVNVGLLDKMVKPNTGKITFASAAGAVSYNSNGKPYSPYAFTSIENPYEVYKRIKEIYDNYKANK